MKERRKLLKVASLLPIAILDSLTKDAHANPITGDSSQGGAGSHRTQLPPIPPPSTPVEKEFLEDHLLGRANKYGNLFGETRPRTWSETKSEVRSALQSSPAKPSDPIHHWLQTFSLNFDERSSAIVLKATAILHNPDKPPELRYEPQLYDASLRSAAAQLDRCLKYRNEMGSFEISGVNAGISYLTFLKLRPIQRNLLIQTSSSDLEELEKSIEARTRDIYGEGHGISGWFEKSQLLGLRSDADGGVLEADLASQKDRLRTMLLEKTFNIQVDAQLAEFTRLLSPGSSSNFAERYLRLLELLTEDLTDIYAKLFSAANGIAQVYKIESVPGGRDGKLSVRIPQFADRSMIDSFIHSVVAPSADLRSPDILDAFVLWCRATMRELDRRSQYETEFTVSIPLSQPTGKATTSLVANVGSSLSNNGGRLSFNLNVNAIPFITAPSQLRLMGVGLSVERSVDDASPLQYQQGFPPTPGTMINAVGTIASDSIEPTTKQIQFAENFESIKMARLNATVVVPPQALNESASYKRPSLFLTNIRIQGGNGGDLEPTLTYDPACRNANPFGSWIIQFDPNEIVFFPSQSAVPASWVSGVILHLRLRGNAS